MVRFQPVLSLCCAFYSYSRWPSGHQGMLAFVKISQYSLLLFLYQETYKKTSLGEVFLISSQSGQSLPDEKPSRSKRKNSNRHFMASVPGKHIKHSMEIKLGKKLAKNRRQSHSSWKLLCIDSLRFSGRPFNVTQRRSSEIQTSSITKQRTLLSLSVVKL